MPIFYVYMRWYRASNDKSPEHGRQLLTCESRHVADEFFRALQSLNGDDGNKRFIRLERRAPQFWVYDTAVDDIWSTAPFILRNSALSDFGPKIMTTLLDDASGRQWPIIPIVDGPDWFHNRTYFIRSKLQPDLFWYHLDGYILVSDNQKTKFRIRGVDLGKDDEKVLIRSDRVEISLLDKNVKDIYVSREPGSDVNRLKLSWDPREWKFGDFFGGFGKTWVKEGETVLEYLTWANNEDGEEWELC